MKPVLLVLLGLLQTSWIAPVSSSMVATSGLPSIVYVKADAPGAHNGSSWTDAYTSLQSALSNHPGSEIWVAKGVYVPGATRESTFSIPTDTKVFGGFAGVETLREERDWAANVTVLSGDIDGNDVVDENGVVLDPDDIVGANAYRVVLFSGVGFDGTTISAETELDGFTISGGQADGRDGGGIRCIAVHIGEGTECRPSLTNLIVQGNRAAAGGGMYLYANWDLSTHASPRLRSVIFRNNHATDRGGAVAVTAVEGGVSSPVFDEVVFSENRAGDHGGAISIEVGIPSFPVGFAAPILTDVSFFDNVAARGGAVALTLGSSDSGDVAVEMDRVRFIRNQAVGEGATQGLGGALFQSFGHSSSLRILNSEFRDNSADQRGGAIHHNQNEFSNVSPLYLNASFRGNTAPSGGVLYVELFELTTPELTFSNSILWGNSETEGGVAVAQGGELIFESSLVQGGATGADVVLEAAAVATDRGGNLDADPRFVSVDDLHLDSTSPAIDAGDDLLNDSLLDLDRVTRRVDGDRDGTVTIDMGAFEYGAMRIFVDGFEPQVK